MLKLRAEHLAAFEQLADDVTVERVAAAMYVARPETRALPADEFLAEVARQCRHAKRYNLEQTADLAIYTDCAWCLGPDFDRAFPVIRGILDDVRAPGEVKAERIAEHTRHVLLTLAEED